MSTSSLLIDKIVPILAQERDLRLGWWDTVLSC